MDHSLGSQLMGCETATLVQQFACCTRVYCIVLPNGSRFKAKGLRTFSFSDELNASVLEARYTAPFCELPFMEVKFCDAPSLKIRKKGITSRSILILNEADVPVLKIRMPIWLTPHAEFQVFGDNDTEVCMIRKDWGDYDVQFPVDLDVRYKAALLVSCMFVDFLNRR